MYRLFSFLSVCIFAFGATIPFKKTSQEYIVGGNITNITEIPYQISLLLNRGFLCGGSIITATHVLTAAHCVSHFHNLRAKLDIRAGSSEVYGHGTVVSIKKFTYHPKFSRRNLDYDVAVLELSTPLNFSDSIKAIKLADKPPAAGELVRPSGWGYTTEGGSVSKYLQSVMLPIVERKTCEKNYQQYMPITPRMICAGIEGKDSCQGDSGGPLVYKNTLVGIISSGIGCGRKDYPGIYTNIADPEIRKYIQEQANV